LKIVSKSIIDMAEESLLNASESERGGKRAREIKPLTPLESRGCGE
jgi:hypothetical protein